MPGEIRRWSQYEEDEIIHKFFGDRVCRFLDVGAHGAKDNSNTRALMDRGWAGLCIEPSPIVFPHLMNNVAAYPGVVCVNVAIDDQPGFREFHENNGDQMGTIDVAHRDIWIDRGSTYNGSFWLQAVTPLQILHAFPARYEFVSIDTEGTNLRVLKAFPLMAIGCELICVEKEPGGEMINYLRAAGYRNIQETGGNYLASR